MLILALALFQAPDRAADRGRSWRRVGLEKTRAISRIRIHPSNPDLVYVAAQGSPDGPTKERGIYRSRDGGDTWQKLAGGLRAGMGKVAVVVPPVR